MTQTFKVSHTDIGTDKKRCTFCQRPAVGFYQYVPRFYACPMLEVRYCTVKRHATWSAELVHGEEILAQEVL